MKRRLAFLALLFALSGALLIGVASLESPDWLPTAEKGASGVLWQVQTTFLSVGFAGLAIAAQLFAETPLAVGASRRQILERIEASRFVGIGLVANAVIAVEALWLSSPLGLLLNALIWFTLTIILLVRSSVQLMHLFGRPSQVDEVIRESLKNAYSERLKKASHRYAKQKRQLKKIVILDRSPARTSSSSGTFEVPVRSRPLAWCICSCR